MTLRIHGLVQQVPASSARRSRFKSSNFYPTSGFRKWSIQLLSVVKHLLKRGSFPDSEFSQLSEQRLVDAVRCVSLDLLSGS